MNTSFHCSCGHVFPASAVERALSAAELIRCHLIEHIQSMNDSEKRIVRTTQSSLGSFLESICYEVGRLLGYTVGKVKKFIASIGS